MTQMNEAIKGNITEEMKQVAMDEKLDAEYIRRMVAKGYIAIPNNTQRESVPVGIGQNLRTKVNATIGTSTDIINLEEELEKAKVAESAGCDTLMELSIGGDLDHIRRSVLKIPKNLLVVFQSIRQQLKQYRKMDLPFTWILTK